MSSVYLMYILIYTPAGHVYRQGRDTKGRRHSLQCTGTAVPVPQRYVTYCTGGLSRNPLYVRTASGSVFFSVTARVVPPRN